MQITMLDMSGDLNFEPDDVVEGDLVVVFSNDSKDEAGLAGRKLAQFMYSEIKFEETDEGLLIIKVEKGV